MILLRTDEPAMDTPKQKQYSSHSRLMLKPLEVDSNGIVPGRKTQTLCLKLLFEESTTRAFRARHSRGVKSYYLLINNASIHTFKLIKFVTESNKHRCVCLLSYSFELNLID
ncbi:hypothetical protein A0J61_03392 [Choanephora cucurbitarum]|uniref:Uncharacterized protein n=1 Tax=Choanephora cucurbitarum TaxID=101091 RepID=A0A1C7NHE8_9FUNG|nr:hypothetical protein A0J61_03392 [Choanephora cucurbitarum]